MYKAMRHYAATIEKSVGAAGGLVGVNAAFGSPTSVYTNGGRPNRPYKACGLRAFAVKLRVRIRGIISTSDRIVPTT